MPSEHHRVTFPSYCAVLFLVKLGLVWQVSSKCSCKDGVEDVMVHLVKDGQLYTSWRGWVEGGEVGSNPQLDKESDRGVLTF